MAGTQPREHTRTYFLGKLADELAARGLEATIRPHPLVLRVSDPRTTMFSESVDCVALADEHGASTWFYRWSWGEVVSRADDPAVAADKIARVFVS